MSGMKRRAALRGLGLALAALGLPRLGRRALARWLGLPPPRYRVVVERDLRVAMPDGVVLLADHYAPRTPELCPTILLRTGYGRGRDVGFPLGALAASRARRFAERGYHVVVQTTRGRFDSGGTFAPCVDAAADGRATLEWVARRPWFNGALGMWGPSQLGYVQWAVAADAPPYLKALVPSVATPGSTPSSTRTARSPWTPRCAGCCAWRC
jgi:predicted acyl esterase